MRLILSEFPAAAIRPIPTALVSNLHACAMMALLMIGALMMPSASAQIIINYAEKGVPPDAGLELLQEEPHDIIYFKESAGGGWVKVHLLPFPQR